MLVVLYVLSSSRERLIGNRQRVTSLDHIPCVSFLVAAFVEDADGPTNLDRGRLGHLHCIAVIRRRYQDTPSVVGVYTRQFFIRSGEVFSGIHAFSCKVKCHA